LRKFLLFFTKGLIGLFIATAFLVLYFILQQVTYSEPDKVYLMGTKISYLFPFFFMCVVVFFLFSFIKHRSHPEKLKRRFIAFTVFYLLASPLVILSFDNYLQITRKGIVYNRFWTIGDSDVRRWKEIDEVVLDYREKRFPVRDERDLRLRYIVRFKNGPEIDLNNYNSPLYQPEEFKAIHRAILKYGVKVRIAQPLPAFVHPHSFLYELFHMKPEKVEEPAK
jgi:hypothetical protein